ncbi:hypothetical protein [Leptolyngbya sp. FACHB-16]|uniref:hypothetical protein n=1 Tax=Leptolyngbya sp. NM3-A1 TaxID=2933910 RepID=UPI001689CD52|nr:hypothetical protein [Leptolyngbya sp. FACHB-16]
MSSGLMVRCELNCHRRAHNPFNTNLVPPWSCLFPHQEDGDLQAIAILLNPTARNCP